MSKSTFNAETLVAALRHRAARRPDTEHLTLLGPGGPEGVTFAELLADAEAVARGLASRGVSPGHTVALMLPTGRDFFASFMGVLFADAVPVPIYPPVRLDQLEEYAERQAGILKNAGVRALITVRQAENLALLLRPRVPSLKAIVRPEKLAADGRREPAAPAAIAPDPEDLALIQYTSGSTGDPKGVSLTHSNLISNIRSIGEAVEVRRDDVVVCWLPLYHDMGLIGCWLFSVCFGLRMISLSPLAFLRRPRRWLEAVTAYRGTLSAAPNFAFELCLRRLKDADLEELDLSSWRVALSGAEPIDPDTIERFSERFGACGFRRETMLPAYGLAENSVAVTFAPLAEAPRIDRVEREAFQRRHRAVAAADGDAGALRFVSVGRPIPGNEVRLVDDRGRPVSERIEGEIQFRGPSATAGYYRNPEASAAIRTADGWIRTGDKGYLAGGDLFITGRLKDVIIKAGRNLHPSEVESVAASVDGIRKGCVAAFGVPSERTGSEDLVVVAETRLLKDPEVLRRLASEIKRRVAAEVKVSPDAVELVPPRTIPKTPSGKLRRAETRERYLSGSLEPRRRPVWFQVLRLAGAGAGAYLLAWLWRGPLARWRSAHEAAEGGANETEDSSPTAPP